MTEPITSRKYFDAVYIPVGLIIVGTLIVKRDWAPYGVAVALAMGGWKFYSLRESDPTPPWLGPIILTEVGRAQEGPEARCLPGVRAQGEDRHLPQCRHVSARPPYLSRPALLCLEPALTVLC